MRGLSAPGRVVSFLSRISTRLLAFNLLIVFLPIAGFLSLGTYERQLLASLERSLVQQGRVLAAALEDSGASLPRENAFGHPATPPAPRGATAGRGCAGHAACGLEQARPAARLARRSGGNDGRRAGEPRRRERHRSREPQPARRRRRSSTGWRPFPSACGAAVSVRPQPPTESDEYYAGATRAQRAGDRRRPCRRYGAATRMSRGQQSVTLYSAIPVFSSGKRDRAQCSSPSPPSAS